MSGLTERLEVAVGQAMRARGAFPHGGRVDADQVRGGIVAGLEVLAEEFGPRPEDAAPPVRELPTEPGAVVLATRMYGIACDARVLVHAPGDDADDEPWCDPTKGTLQSSRWSAAGDIDEWQPATVVPTAAHEAAVAALRDVVALLHGPQSGDAQEAQDAAIHALALIDGSAAS